MRLTPSSTTPIFPAIALFLSAFLLLSASCNTPKQMAVSQELKIVKATKVTHLPGVQSNLRSTTNYKVTLQGNLSQDIKILYLLIDDIRIPVRSVLWDGKEMKGNLLNGEVKTLLIEATHYKYDSDATVMALEEVEYELSGKMIEQGAEIEYVDAMGVSGYIAIESVEKLNAVIHP